MPIYDNENLVEGDYCVKCGNDANYVCKVCGATYCSTTCQKIDWRDHRYICVKLPKLLQMSSKDVKIETNDALNEDRHANQSLSNNFAKIDENAENNFNTLNKSKCNGQYGYERQQCNHDYKLHEEFGGDDIEQRRKEFQQQSKNIHNSLSRGDQQSFSQLRKNYSTPQNNNIKERYRPGSKQQQHKLCNPENVKQYGQQKRERNKFDDQKHHDYVFERQSNTDNAEKRRHDREQCNNQQDESKVIEQYFKDGQSRRGLEYQSGNLQNCSDKKQIIYYQNYETQQRSVCKNQKQCESNKYELQYQNKPNLNAHLLKPPFEIVKFSENTSNFEALVVDISAIQDGILVCIPQSCYQSFIKMQSFLIKMEKDGQPYQPVLNEYCVALFEGEWYRAKVIAVKETLIKVKYIDYANVAYVQIKDIRRYPAELTLVSSTNLCKLAGLPNKLSSDLSTQLEKMIDIYHKVYVKNVIMNGETYEIECPVILKELSELGFI